MSNALREHLRKIAEADGVEAEALSARRPCLENADIQLTNHIAVTDAVIAIVKDSQHRPDEIYLVESCHEPWQVIPVLVGDTSALELGENWYWQIASSELEDLTGRC